MAIKFTNEHSFRKHNENEEYIDYAEGSNGSIKVHDTTVELIRKGLNARLLGLRGNKEIQISSITSIQFKEPGMLTNGFIQFSFSGSQERKGGVFEATKDENSIVFTKKNLKNFVIIRNLINRKRDELQNVQHISTVSRPTNSFDDLEKLAQLRDKGIVTQEEFDAKKKQILGL